MKQQLLFLGIIALSCCGCNQENEIGPINELVGSYEFNMKNVGNNYELDFVDRLQFYPDGLVYGEGVASLSGTNQILGYRYYFHGSYKIEEGIVSITGSETFQTQDEASFFDSKDELVYKDGRQVWDQFSMEDNFQKLHSICPPNANCLNIIFNKSY